MKQVEFYYGEHLNYISPHAWYALVFLYVRFLLLCILQAPLGHTSASVIPLIKVGRGMYSVMHKDSRVTRFLVCQIYSMEGSKYIKIRSPFQVRH